jgi:hypothetical protein
VKQLLGSGNGGALDDREPDSDYVYTKKEFIKILANRRGCLGANLQQRKVILAEIAQTYQRKQHPDEASQNAFGRSAVELAASLEHNGDIRKRKALQNAIGPKTTLINKDAPALRNFVQGGNGKQNYTSIINYGH